MTPVILFTYNRSKNLARTLECLRNNKIDLLYIFSDGPKDAADEVKVGEVRKLLDQINWVKTEKFYQEKNLGLSASVIFGINKVLENFQSVICIEDDICVAPDFYSYMQTCLEKYKDDTKIAGVTGIRFPFTGGDLDNYSSDVFFLPRFSSWGWGTWRRFWQTVDFKQESIVKKIKAAKLFTQPMENDVRGMIKSLVKGELHGGWDVNCGICMLLNNQSFVWPTHNMVENSGLTEGVHATKESTPWQLNWEAGKLQGAKPVRFPKTEDGQEQIRASFLKFLKSNLNANRRLNKIIFVLKNHFLMRRGLKETGKKIVDIINLKK